MLASIVQDVKREFSSGNMVTRIIIINVVVFIAINVIRLVLFYGSGGVTPEFYFQLRNFFCVSGDWWHNLTHPWAVITSMFMHEGFMHILFNMLIFYWFGKIVGDLIGDHRIAPIYLLGGIVGALVYFISANLMPDTIGSFAYGASAGVMAIVVASGVLSPDYNFNLLFIGNVKLKYIVATMVFLDMIGTTTNVNSGGHFAHLGGALFGWFFVSQLRNGEDWSEPVNKLLARISEFWDNLTARFSGEPRRPKVIFRNPNRTKGGKAPRDEDSHSYQERLDSILDKIKSSGYDSLSVEEKEFLFKASKK